MATTTYKPSAYSLCFPQYKRRLLLVLLIATASIFATVSMFKIYQNYSSLNNPNQKRMLELEQSSAHSNFKVHHLEERMKALEQALAQKSSNLEGKQTMKELEAQKLQFQQRIQVYEQQILSLTQEMKLYREQNQLIRQDQIKMKSEYQELLNKLNQRSQGVGSSQGQDNLEKVLESRLSQFVNADYEHEQKFKELQRAIENCAKVGELKALEVYYDDKIDSLNNVVIQNNQQKPSSAGQAKTVSTNPQQIQQLKQEIMKLNMEKEDMRNIINSLSTQQRKNEERLKNIEAQENQNNNIKKSFSSEQTETPKRLLSNNIIDQPQQEPMRGSEEGIQNMRKRPTGMPEQNKGNCGGSHASSAQRENLHRRQNNPHFGFMNQDHLMRHMNFGPRNMFSNFPRQRHMNNCMFC